MPDGRCDESAEQRVGVSRTGLELRMSLGGHEVRMGLTVQLDKLSKAAIGGSTTNTQPSLLQTVTVGVVDLVTVTVAFGNCRRAIQFGDQGVLGKLGRVGPQTHRSTEIGLAGHCLDLLCHRRDDRIGGL